MPGDARLQIELRRPARPDTRGLLSGTSQTDAISRDSIQPLMNPDGIIFVASFWKYLS
jgi:hypothetical protein